MRPRLEVPLIPPIVCLALVLTGCQGARATAERLPSNATSLAVAPDFAGTLWEMTGERAWRSRDGGLSWQVVRGPGGAIGIAFSEKGGRAVGPRGSQHGAYGGVALSRPVPTPQVFVSITTPYHRTDRLYALDLFGHLWLSADAGRKWAQLRAARLPSSAVAVAAVRGDVVKPDVIYAACGIDGLWRSLDDGATFTHVPDPKAAYAVAMTTDDQSRVLVAGDRLYLSTDYGRTFLPVLDRRVDAVAFDPRNDRLAYAAVGRELLRSVDGGHSWP